MRALLAQRFVGQAAAGGGPRRRLHLGRCVAGRRPAPARHACRWRRVDLPVPASSTTARRPTTTTTVAPTTTSVAPADHGARGRPPPRPPPAGRRSRRPLPGRSPGPRSAAAGRASCRCRPRRPATSPSTEGLGTWVDAYDFSPQYQPNGAPPPVTPETMDDLAAVGVKTLYLQAAKDDIRSPGDLVNPEILGPDADPGPRPGHQGRGLVPAEVLRPRLRHAPLPGHAGLPGRAATASTGSATTSSGRGTCPTTPSGAVRLIELSRRLRAAMGYGGAVGHPAAARPHRDHQPEVLARTSPGGSWRRSTTCGCRCPTGRSARRAPATATPTATPRRTSGGRGLNLGLPDAVVHPIGGTDNKSNDDDYRNFVRACVDTALDRRVDLRLADDPDGAVTTSCGACPARSADRLTTTN